MSLEELKQELFKIRLEMSLFRKRMATDQKYKDYLEKKLAITKKAIARLLWEEERKERKK